MICAVARHKNFYSRFSHKLFHSGLSSTMSHSNVTLNPDYVWQLKKNKSSVKSVRIVTEKTCRLYTFSISELMF